MNAPRIAMTAVGVAFAAIALTLALGGAERMGGFPIPGVSGPETAGVASTDAVELRVALDQTRVTYDDDTSYLLVEVTGRDDAETRRTPVSMAIVIDVSGSMMGEKITNARIAAHQLVDRLADGDRVTLVTYSDAAEVVLSNYQLSADRSYAHAMIDGIAARGGTCISCGLEEAYRTLRTDATGNVRRVVLMSDGHANAGISSEHELAALAGDEQMNRIPTATIGLGTRYNADLMTAIAIAGEGAYYHLPDATAMASIFDREMSYLSRTVAQDVRVMVTPFGGATFGTPDAVGFSWRGPALEFRVGQLAAGESRQFLIPVSLPEGELNQIAVTSVQFVSGSDRSFNELSVGSQLGRTADPAEAHASVNVDVVTRQEQLEAAREIEQALAAYQSGDTDVAVGSLRALAQELDDAGAGYGAEGITEEAEQVRMLVDELESGGYAPGSQDVVNIEQQNTARNNEIRRGLSRDEMYHGDTVVH